MVKIKVTQEHILNGSNGSAFCPIALAISEKFPLREVHVGIMYARVGADTYYPLPWEGKQFVRRFDTHVPVQPFEFDLPLGVHVIYTDSID